ncbi:MAG: DUF1566 domain-containing protein [Desulfobacula sp.]|nr:DUF1566 domain-containing protein [Desulfobacula sp.]
MNKFPAVSIFFLVFLLFIFTAPGSVHAKERFIDNADGTVTDTLLNVMWSKTDNHGNINWRQAQQWVKYTFPYTLPTSYDNWRLPAIDELKTLYDQNTKGYETDCGQKVKIVPVIELTCGWVWASEMESISARLFNFHRGYSYTDRISKYRAYRVLAVRSLE